MQRTKLVRGALERGLEIPPIDAAVNKILDNNPGMRLVQVTVVNVKYTSCLLLCTFETSSTSETSEEETQEI
ncbi:MAG: hypothetical protein IKP69_07520 [Oscillospiraceae bacterium]|nr:hypothetical protein [Oscillospiraceae bacterium]